MTKDSEQRDRARHMAEPCRTKDMSVLHSVRVSREKVDGLDRIVVRLEPSMHGVPPITVLLDPSVAWELRRELERELNAEG